MDHDFEKRLKNCCTIHWNGWFYVLTPLVLLPLIFTQPLLECRTIFTLLWSLLWYIFEPLPVGILATLPIVTLPLLGLISSNEVCMVYTTDSQIVFFLSGFVASTFEYTEVTKRIAYIYLRNLSCNPRMILVIFMVQSYIMSILLPDAMVCAFMIPLAKDILQILENISVTKLIDESKELKDDEKPFNTRVVNGIFIGTAYAVNIGGMATTHSAEVGLSLRNLVDDILPKSTLQSGLDVKYLSFSMPVSLLILIFTIFYLEYIFFGFLRNNSSNAHEIAFDEDASISALESMESNLPPYNVHMILTLFIYLFALVITIWVSYTGLIINGKILKFSVNSMCLCYMYFVLPRKCDFCNYFICKKPDEYKRTPSVLTWSVASKGTPWNYFLVYGNSLVYGLLLYRSGMHKYFGQSFVNSGGTAKQIGFVALTLAFTLMGANHMVADFMLKLGAQAALTDKVGPASFLFPIMWASCISFLLPISSVANCFASGWANLRSKDVLLAGIGPTVFGFLFVLVISCFLPILPQLAY